MPHNLLSPKFLSFDVSHYKVAVPCLYIYCLADASGIHHFGTLLTRLRRSNAPPCTMVLAGLAGYASSVPGSIPITANKAFMYQGDMKVVDEAIIRTMSAMAVVVALVYCHQHGEELAPPDPNRSFISNILLMMGFEKRHNKVPISRVLEYMERLWILYSDHEMSNSTSAFLHVASTLADPISCCTAYVAAGSGPLHAGAIDLAYKTFARLETPDRVPAHIAEVRARQSRLFGYGHRIYKTVDPRSKFISKMLAELQGESKDEALLAVAVEIDRIASKDDYFTSRNLKVNADLYGCFVYTALYDPPFFYLEQTMYLRLTD